MLKIALVCALIGVIVLFFISSNLEASEKTIDKINKEHIGEDVKLIGRISRIVETEKVYFIELTQPATISVLLFKDGNGLDLTDGDNVEIIGEIDEYEGEIEVIAHRIRVMK